MVVKEENEKRRMYGYSLDHPQHPVTHRKQSKLWGSGYGFIAHPITVSPITLFAEKKRENRRNFIIRNIWQGQI